MHLLQKLSVLICCFAVCVGAAAQSKPAPDDGSRADRDDGVQAGKSERLQTLSIGNSILPDTTREEWAGIREKIRRRIQATYGEPPVPLAPTKTRFEEIERYRNLGLTHIRYRYQVIGDEWQEAICVLPPKMPPGGRAPAVVTIHGTNGKQSKFGMLGIGEVKNRAYGIELARRGYVTFSPDLFGYGAGVKDISQEELLKGFYERYPKWTASQRRTLGLVRALDVLDQLPYVRAGAYGAMGNSLGGAATLFLAMTDGRVRAAVVSTGVSPLKSNVFRNITGGKINNPVLNSVIEKTGKPPWDMHEVIALCAPRAVLFLEPFNDPFNPDVLPVVESVYSASQVYRLLGTPERLGIVVHGDGHDTIDDVREYSYRWFDRFLQNDAKTNE